MQSRVLGEALAYTPSTELPKKIPLAGDAVKDMQYALSYIYRSANTRPAKAVEFTSLDEAVSVAQFAHKYDARALASEAEDFLQHQVKGMATWLPGRWHMVEKKRSGTASKTLELASSEKAGHWDVMDMLAFASHIHSEKLERLCLQMLINLPGGRECLRSDARLELLGPVLLGQLVRQLA